MNRLKEEFNDFCDKGFDGTRPPFIYGSAVDKLWNWINQNYISKEEILKQDKSVHHKPTKDKLGDEFSKFLESQGYDVIDIEDYKGLFKK